MIGDKKSLSEQEDEIGDPKEIGFSNHSTNYHNTKRHQPQNHTKDYKTGTGSQEHFRKTI